MADRAPVLRRISILVAVCVALFFLWQKTFGARMDALQRAQVWAESDIENKNILDGPQNNVSVPPDQEVACVYVESKGPDVGYSPKFQCRLESSGEIVRVKYSNRETLAEVAGTRLLWALGFFTDETYPVKLRCVKCPEKNPGSPSKNEKRGTYLISDSIIERRFPGKTIQVYEDQGWRWRELSLVDADRGGATKAEIDALKLLAVFIQHTDSKFSQQRIACYEEDVAKDGCRRPVLMVQDVGATFGIGSAKINSRSVMYLKGWSSADIWLTKKEEEYFREEGKRKCFGNLFSGSRDGLHNPEISEEGRAFLAGLLNRLSDQQIHDLFQAARVERANEMILDNGKLRKSTIEDWVQAFKKKRDQINSRKCSQ